MGGFLSTSAKPLLQLLSGCFPFFSCLELSPCASYFPYLQLDFANFASLPIIMELCKEFRGEWESVHGRAPIHTRSLFREEHGDVVCAGLAPQRTVSPVTQSTCPRLRKKCYAAYQSRR